MSPKQQAIRSNFRPQQRLACGLIPLLNMLQDHGVGAEQVLAEVNIRKLEFIDPAFTISLEQELKIVEQALDTLTAADASLQLARYYHLHHFSVLGLAIRACDTLADIFALIRTYPRLQWGICETTGTIDGDDIEFELVAGETRVERFLLERDMACAKTVFGEALNSELKLQQVAFSYPPPANIGDYENFFNCPVRFNQPVSSLRVAIEQLSRPVPTADPLSKAFYEAQCTRLSAQIDEPFRYVYLVRDQLLRQSPIPPLEQLSQQLDIEPRTLQRLLKKEGQTFSQILREVREKRACDRLQTSALTAEQIALELGFNDAVAFSHAFKKWTGLAPRQWRQQTQNT